MRPGHGSIPILTAMSTTSMEKTRSAVHLYCIFPPSPSNSSAFGRTSERPLPPPVDGLSLDVAQKPHPLLGCVHPLPVDPLPLRSQTVKPSAQGRQIL